MDKVLDACGTICSGDDAAAGTVDCDAGSSPPDTETPPTTTAASPSSPSASSSEKSPQNNKKKQQYVVVKVKSANLTKNFEILGQRMDPFAVVSWLSSDNDSDDTTTTKTTKKLLSRTHTLWNAHKTPAWDYTCRGHAYNTTGGSSSERVEIALWEDGNVSSAVWMGSAVVAVDELLGMGGGTNPTPPGKESDDIVLPVIWHGKKNRAKTEQTGTVTVTTVLVEVDSSAAATKTSTSGAAATSAAGTVVKTDDVTVTRVDPSLFVSPVKRLGVSGGTAPFFALKLVNPPDGRTENHYIGKDLSRAVDEIAFYEEMLSIVNSDNEECGLRDMLKFGFEYAGVLTAPEEGVEAVAEEEDGGDDGDASSNERELLVLRNLRDGCETLRLLDLKMGEKTASAGWHGKSWSHAYRQGVMDKTTNSYVEGFRLEGFDGRPETLVTMDPLMDYDNQKSAKSLKKASRMLLQHMDGREIALHFLDLHQGPTADADANLDEVYSNAELSELVMHEIVTRLAKLGAVCNNVTVPQKWVGSSVALGYDSGALPPRSKDESAIRSTVLVNIFDWGRSELNTIDKMQHMTAEEQKDRATFWGYYKGGIERLGWTSARTYLHRFGNADQWKEVTLTIYDFDAMSKDDYMGSVVVPVEETDVTEVKLGNNKGRETDATLTYSLHYRPLPSGSRLKGTWRVVIKSAKNLPNMDDQSVSDPYCVVKALSADGQHCFEQVTRVIHNDLNPVWEETLDLPLAADADALKKALEAGKAGLSEGNLDLFHLLPRGASEGTALRSATVSTIRSKETHDPGFIEWSSRLAA
mmetsp:Transcript_11591/g.23814  ORF Transcript_11591/g.23814 Transcript_11591/m.23814 type:complete len:808 (-) Transcript_11591:58-2481(-)